MKLFFTSLILFLVFIDYSFSQSDNISSLQGKLLISVSAGIIIPQTDFKVVRASLFGIGTIEYYLKIKSMHALGFRLNGGGSTLKGIDERSFPGEFIDNIFFLFFFG